MEGFPFATEVRVRFAETDAQGIAHHAAFLVWLEVARIAYLEAFAGGYPAIREHGLEALTTEVRVRYLRAAAFDDRLTIWTRCEDVRGARFRYEYRVTRGGELVAEAETAHALVDRKTYRPTRLPAWLAEAISAAEARRGRPRRTASPRRAASSPSRPSPGAPSSASPP
ncbi:MAG TPA: thioesterase family protein [Gaiellaceae bacterium]|nr:thioesterase family protein [Gaiellaceae bacterium]